MRKRQSKTHDNFQINQNLDFTLQAPSNFIKAQKQDFKYFMQLKNQSDGLITMTFELFCNQKDWVADDQINKCKGCQQNFNFFKRRHHCRCCGEIFCSNCLKYEIILKNMQNLPFNDNQINIFLESFKCKYDNIQNHFMLKICNECFSINIDTFFKDIKQFRIYKEKRIIPHSKQFSVEYKQQNELFKKQMKKEFGTILKQRIEIKEKNSYLTQEFIEDIIYKLFENFENLLSYNIDFSQTDLQNLIEIVRILSVYNQIDIFPGIILDINKNTYFKDDHTIYFPTIILIRKKFLLTNVCENGKFNYLTSKQVKENQTENIDFLQDLISDVINKSQQHSNIFVFSRHTLPTKIYFFLKRKNIDFIFPIKQSKLNLISRYIKSSPLYQNKSQQEKSDYEMEIENKGIQILGFAGEIFIKKIMITDSYSYKIFMKKHFTPSHQFNTFSIQIKGELDSVTKRLKEVLKIYLPAIFQKFLEINVLQNELLFYQEISQKSLLDLKDLSIANIDFDSLNQNKKIDFQVEKLFNFIDENKEIVYYNSQIIIQNESNTFQEFKPLFKILNQNFSYLQDQLNDNFYSMREFNSLNFLYDKDTFSYLANLNLSKHNNLVRSCGQVTRNNVTIYGDKDQTIFKKIDSFFRNNEAKCICCETKQKYHSQMFYFKNFAVKMNNRKIKSIGNDHIYLQQIQHDTLNFSTKEKPWKKLKGQNFYDFKNQIKTGIACLHCFKIISKLYFANEVYRCLSFTLFLCYFIFNQPFNNEEKIRNDKVIQSLNRIMSLDNIDDFVNQHQIGDKTDLKQRINKDEYEKYTRNLSTVQNKKQKQTVQCFHSKVGRIFIKGQYLISFEKFQITRFYLMTNSDLKSIKIDNSRRLQILKTLYENFDYMLRYYIFSLSYLEKLFFEKSKSYVKQNLQVTMNIQLKLRSLQIKQEPFIISEKSQKASNENFISYLCQLGQKLKILEENLNQELTLENNKLRIDQLDQICEYFDELKNEKQNKNNLEPPQKLFKRSLHENMNYLTQEIKHSSSFVSNNQTINQLQSENLQESLDNSFSTIENNHLQFEKNSPNNLIGLKQNNILFYEAAGNYFSNYLCYKKTHDLQPEDNQHIDVQLNFELDENKCLDKLDYEFTDTLKKKFDNLYDQKQQNIIPLFSDFMKLQTQQNLPQRISFRLKEYFSSGFRKVREMNRIQDDYFYHSLSEVLNFQPQGGKTKAAFYLTHDQKYVIKEVGRTEFKSFCNFCPDYLTYLIETSNQNKKSFLVLIFGVFKVKNKRFIIMENLRYFLKNSKDNIKIYDLKGSELNRLVQKVKENSTLPDTNFQIERNSEPIYLYNKKIPDMNYILQKDTLFLSKKSLIDYSLLLIINIDQQTAFMKIIDYLRSFDFLKNLENKFKQLKFKEALPTIVQPEDYRERFLKSVENYFVFFNNQFNNQQWIFNKQIMIQKEYQIFNQ